MLKLIGAAMIIATGAFWGYSRSAMLKCRADSLSAIISALNLLESEVSYAKSSIKSALLSSGRACGAEIFTYAAEKVDEIGVGEAFSAAVDNKGTCLSEKDRTQLKLLCQNMGISGASAQLKSIAYVKELMCAARLNAEMEYEKSGRLYRSIGVLAACAAVILLL